MNLFSLVLGVLFFPVTLLASWCVVKPNEEYVILYWGKLDGVIKEPGISFINIWGRTIIKISTRFNAIELHKTTVADANGNPIVIAGICTFKVINSELAALQVDDFDGYIQAQSIAVLKQIAARYPYESADGHNLKNEAQVISAEMVQLLQNKVSSIGLSVLSFEISDLAYAPEIAAQMLARQQAQALISARKVIVEGAVNIVEDAVEKIRAKGIAFSNEATQRLVSNLLVVICGDAKVTPTFAVEDEDNRDNHEMLAKIQAVLVDIREQSAKH